LLLASGCASIHNERVNKKSISLKSPSLTQYDITHINGESLDAFVDNRTARIHKNVRVTKDKYDKNRGKVVLGGSGIAVAIAKQGYFLTAAHCVENANVNLMIAFHSEPISFKPARVVWLSKEYDIALISIGKPLKTFFEMAQNIPDHNSIAIAGGFLKHSAGRVLSLSKTSTTDDGLMLINHNCPIVDGDSGGPLITQNGFLLGINHSTSFNKKLFSTSISNYEATAIDSKWLQDQVQHDITSQSMRRP
jgi:S1-C subfamily serine protease